MSLDILFHVLCAQHVSDINISIFRNLQTLLMNYHIGRLVLNSLCVGAFVAVDISRNKSSNTQRTENKTTDVVIHQQSRRFLKMDILMSETC